MAYTTTPTNFMSSAQARTSMYQQYLKDLNFFSDYSIGLCAGRGAIERIQRTKTMQYLQSLRDDETSTSTSTQPNFVLPVKDHPITSQSLFGDEILKSSATVTPLPSTKYLYCNFSVNINYLPLSTASTTTFGLNLIPPRPPTPTISGKHHIAYLKELKSLRLAKNEKLAKEKVEREEGTKESRGDRLGRKEVPMMKRKGKRREACVKK